MSVVVVFHIRPRSDVNVEEYGAAFVRMVELVQGIPGFVSVDGFTGEDGSELALARFDSVDAVHVWRDHPEHVETRRRGREEFFASYDITVATEDYRYGWPAAT